MSTEDEELQRTGEEIVRGSNQNQNQNQRGSGAAGGGGDDEQEEPRNLRAENEKLQMELNALKAANTPRAQTPTQAITLGAEMVTQTQAANATTNAALTENSQLLQAFESVVKIAIAQFLPQQSTQMTKVGLDYAMKILQWTHDFRESIASRSTSLAARFEALGGHEDLLNYRNVLKKEVSRVVPLPGTGAENTVRNELSGLLLHGSAKIFMVKLVVEGIVFDKAPGLPQEVLSSVSETAATKDAEELRITIAAYKLKKMSEDASAGKATSSATAASQLQPLQPPPPQVQQQQHQVKLPPPPRRSKKHHPQQQQQQQHLPAPQQQQQQHQQTQQQQNHDDSRRRGRLEIPDPPNPNYKGRHYDPHFSRGRGGGGGGRGGRR